MDRDSDIKAILPRYPVMNRVQEVNRQSPEIPRGRREGAAERKKRRRTKSQPQAGKMDAQKVPPPSGEEALSSEEDHAPDGAPQEPGKIIDLMV